MIGSSLNFSCDLDFKPIWCVTTIHAELKRTFVLGAANSPIARTAELWILDDAAWSCESPVWGNRTTAAVILAKVRSGPVAVPRGAAQPQRCCVVSEELSKLRLINR